jgi:hypothetical protein
MKDTPVTAPAADTTARDTARSVIDSGYGYMTSGAQYLRDLRRFAQQNNIAENSDAYRQLDAYFRSQTETGNGPEPSAAIVQISGLNSSAFSSLRDRARDMAAKRNAFSSALTSQGFNQGIIAEVDRRMMVFSGDHAERILDSAIDTLQGDGVSARTRTTGWPEGTEASYEAGRGIQSLLGNAGNWFQGITDSIGGMFSGGGGSSNGGVNFNLGGILGGLGGGIGGFMIGKLFGGGIFGTIASIFLGVFGAYLGASTFGRGGSSNANSGANAANGTGDASASATGAAATNGERTIPMRAADGSVRLVSAAAHAALLNTAAGFSGNVRYNPWRGDEPCPPTYPGGRQQDRFQPAYS